MNVGLGGMLCGVNWGNDLNHVSQSDRLDKVSWTQKTRKTVHPELSGASDLPHHPQDLHAESLADSVLLYNKKSENFSNRNIL